MSSFVLNNYFTEADSKFLADNMLTPDDFDVSSFLMEEDNVDSTCENICLKNESSSEYKIIRECPDFIDDCYASIMGSNIELKMEPISPSPSPAGSSSGYSSPVWSEDMSMTEINMSDSDIPPTDVKTQQPETHLDPNQNTTFNQTNFSSSSILQLPTSPIPLQDLNTFSNRTNKIQIPQLKSSKAVSQSIVNQISDFMPFVLTSEEIVKIASSANLPGNCKVLASNLNTVQRPSSILPVVPNKKLAASTKTQSTPNQQIQDPVVVKRQQRMMRNRESAYLSRKKKKEYVQSLEQQLMELTSENNKIKTENSFLKSKIDMLEKEICRLKKLFSGKDFKKNTCLMVMIFMVTFNLSPLSGLLSGGSKQIKPVEHQNHKLGRTLLWNPENPEAHDLPVTFEEKLSEDNLITLSSEYKNSSCPTYINKTESIRLENELRVWAQRIEKQKEKRKPQRRPSLKALRKQLLVPMPRLQNFMRASRERFTDEEINELNSRGIALFRPLRIPYEDLFEALDRKDDTFYFVSFSGDHLLLPASAHNRTARPKMSLVMPAMALNDTAASNRVTMMQIDCEVMNTKLVHVKESAIPHHMRHKANGTNIKDSEKKPEQPKIFTRRKKANK